MELVEFISKNQVEVLAFLLATSELLALNKKVKANSIFQLVVSFLKSKKV